MKKGMTLSLVALSALVPSVWLTQAQADQMPMKLWYDAPAPYGNEGMATVKSGSDTDDVNDGWERWALPLGNGYLGAMVFGRTRTERIQITEKSLYNPSPEGLNNFSETYIDFGHENPTEYYRDLDLNNAIAHVRYKSGGVTYTREYFTSYPDRVMVIRLNASEPGTLSFTLRPTIPYLKDYGSTPGDGRGKHGSVTASGDTITLSGVMDYYDIHFEAQYKVIASGGKVVAENDANNDNGKLVVTNADSAIILIAVGTNYQLESRVYTENDPKMKLAPYPDPHDKVNDILTAAFGKNYEELKGTHIDDYQTYFDRVQLDLGGEPSSLTTDQLLKSYQAGNYNKYLEELYFQYGRYLLISSSRKGALPANLQGSWNRYDIPPWKGGFWYNINIQMNYWPALNTNLLEMFEPYAGFYQAFQQSATDKTSNYIRKKFPEKYDPLPGGNGSSLGTEAFPYTISSPCASPHSGPGTGPLTTTLLWDYYDFSRDAEILKKTAYPALVSMSKFLTKIVEPVGPYYLTKFSASPEQRHKGEFYQTEGCAFDQQMIYENYKDTLDAAGILWPDDDDNVLSIVEEQIDKLDPVQVGYSGQIKEYREEQFYGEIGQKDHRHISQLVGLYPGTLINHTSPAWLDAAVVTLNLRGDKSTGWAMAHRLNLWARTGNGNKTYELYQKLLGTGTLTNLWDTHPPFQIDGNLGGTAGVAEMLLQSHAGYIAPLPALPDAWSEGSYSGLLARGNVEVSAQWANGQATRFALLPKKGGEIRLRYPGISTATVKTASGDAVHFATENEDLIRLSSVPGQRYIVTNIPAFSRVENPSDLTVTTTDDKHIDLAWKASPDAVSYNLYKAVENCPDYSLIASGVPACAYAYTVDDSDEIGRQTTYRVTAVGANGRESTGIHTLLLAR
ncbi:MAG: glycoside hydrolase family 95 protein [Verrucomicrobiota bacterium JB024]|nr:glycoside hydrolase family 95 protein [Verrucomicrobiota bacterium JB024]